MRKRYTITLSVLTVMILLTLSIGTSYSFYTVTGKQSSENQLTTSCFNVTYNDNGGSSTINLTGAGNYAFPMDWDSAKRLKPYTFTITNNCTAENASQGIDYNILLTSKAVEHPQGDLTNSIEYKLLTGTEAGNKEEKLLFSTAPKFTQLPQIVANDSKYNIAKIFGTEEPNVRVLKNGTLAQNQSITYKLYLWITDSATNDVMNYNFEGDILVYSTLGVAS